MDSGDTTPHVTGAQHLDTVQTTAPSVPTTPPAPATSAAPTVANAVTTVGGVPSPSVALGSSSVRFVYPFLFDVEGGAFDERVRAITGAKWPNSNGNGATAAGNAGGSSVQMWKPTPFDDVEDLLSYVAEFLRVQGTPDIGVADNGTAGSVATGQGFSTPFSAAHTNASLQHSDGLAYSASTLSTLMPTALFWTLNFNDGQTATRRVGCLSWTLMQRGQPKQDTRQEIQFRLSEVQLALFSHGVGFLTLEVKPVSRKVDDWLNFLYYFRFLRGKPYTKIEVEMRDCASALNRQLANTAIGVGGASTLLWQPATNLPPEWSGATELFKVMCSLLLTAVPAASKVPGVVPASQTAASAADLWWKEVFVAGQLIPFTALFVEDPAQQQSDVPTQATKELLFRVRNLFAAEHGNYPAPEDLALDHSGLLPYARLMWFLFSPAGGAFVAFNAPEKPFRTVLAREHLPKHYFLLFLVVLQQRCVLIRLSNMVARQWLPAVEKEHHAGMMNKLPTLGRTVRAGKRRKASSGSKGSKGSSGNTRRMSGVERSEDMRQAFDAILEAFLAFTARGYFTHVIQGERHQRYYEKWQQVFGVEKMYEEVRDEVTQMRDHLEMIESRRLNEAVQLLTMVSILLATSGTIAAWWGMNAATMLTLEWPQHLPFGYLAGLGVVGLLLLVEIIYFTRKRWLFIRRRGRSS